MTAVCHGQESRDLGDVGADKALPPRSDLLSDDRVAMKAGLFASSFR